MNAFDYKNAVFFHANLFTAIFPLSCNKIKLWQFDCLALQQFFQMLIKQIDVNGFNTFKIIAAIRIIRGIYTILIVIIHGQRNGVNPVHFQLHGKPLIG